MAFLLHILLALGASAAVEVSGWSAAPGGDRWMALAGAAIAFGVALPLPHLVARGVHGLGVAGRWRAARLVAGLLEWIAVLGFAAVLLAGWSAAVSPLAGGSLFDWPGPGLLLLLAPYVALELLAIRARVRAGGRPRPQTAPMSRFLRRQLFAAITPLAAYLLVSGAIGAWTPLRVRLEEVALFGSLYALALLAAFALALPTILRRVWNTAPLPAGRLREFLVDLARRGDFRFDELLVWHTGGAVSNAAVVGFTSGQRIVLMTDRLLGELAPRELAAVFGHEMGHSVRRHSVLFTVWTLVLFLLYELTVVRQSGLLSVDPDLGLLGLVAIWYVGFGYLSRRAELDADLFALGITRDAEDLIGALELVGGGAHRWRDGWRHFSVSRRVLFLRAVAADAEVGRRLRGGLDRWFRVGVAGLVVCTSLWVWSQTGGIDRELAWADLRLGRYEQAVERLDLDPASGGGVGEGADPLSELERLSILGLESATEGGGAPGPEELLTRARRLAEAGDLRAARDLVTLAQLLDSESANPIGAWLDAVLAGLEAQERAAEAAGGVPADWALAVERWSSE